MQIMRRHHNIGNGISNSNSISGSNGNNSNNDDASILATVRHSTTLVSIEHSLFTPETDQSTDQ